MVYEPNCCFQELDGFFGIIDRFAAAVLHSQLLKEPMGKNVKFAKTLTDRRHYSNLVPLTLMPILIQRMNTT